MFFPRSKRIRLRKQATLGTSSSIAPPGLSTLFISARAGNGECEKCSSTWQHVTASKVASGKGYVSTSTLHTLYSIEGRRYVDGSLSGSVRSRPQHSWP